MVECDHHPQYRFRSSGTASDLSDYNKKLNLQDELIWGLSYRNLKKKQGEIPIPSKRSPLDISFKICREKERMARQRKKESHKDKKPAAKHKPGKDKPTLLERSVMSQRQYMELLAVPKQLKVKPPPPAPKKKKKCRCLIEPCSPRVVQLALPKKRRVFCNWTDYHHFLPTPMIMKLLQILHTDKNLEPREARYYYKQLDKKRWKLERERRRLRRKAKAEKEKGKNTWVIQEVNETTAILVDYLKNEPLFTLTYKQLLLSDGILEYVERCGAMEKPSRNTTNDFKRTVIEVADKIAVWMDTLTRFVDLQAFDSAEDIPPLTISSIEGEGESEETLYSEEEKYEAIWGLGGALYGEGEGEEGEFGAGRGRSPSETERMMAELFRPQEGEGESDLGAFLDELDLDLLDKLIRILSNCSDEFLEGMVDENRLPGVRYIDILNRVKELRDGLLAKGPQKPFLEQVMLSWAIQNEPDEVDDKLKNKITETAALLGDFLFGAGARGAAGLPGIYEGEGGEEGLGGGDLGQGIGGVGGDKEGLGGEGEGEGVDETFTKAQAGALLGTEGEGGEGGDLEGLGVGEEGGGITDEEKMAALRAEGEAEETLLEVSITEKEKEEALLAGMEREGYEGLLGFGEEAGEVAVLYGPGLEGLEGKIIKGHKPSVILEHRTDMVCCLSLKIWSVWLLEITHNAHNWTKWLHCVIQKVKEFAAVVRGDVLLPNGEKKILYKEDWRKFAKETEEMIVAWRQYSAHVKELSDSIMQNFHGKKILNCCPKCLQDHLIKDVTTAHETLSALTEAINCAAYWQRCLDELVKKTCPLAGLDLEGEVIESSSTSSEESEVSEPCICRKRRTKRRPKKGKDDEDESSESVYEIEEIDVPGPSQGGWGPNQGPGPSSGGPGMSCTPNPNMRRF